MATEDVVIRLRVDDSELRRARGRVPGRSDFTVRSSPARSELESVIIGGAAGSVLAPGFAVSKPTAPHSRGLAYQRFLDEVMYDIAPGTRPGSGAGILDDSAKQAATAGAKDFAEEVTYRGYELGTDDGSVRPSRSARMFMAGYRPGNPVWLPERSTMRHKIDMDNYLENMAPGRHAGRAGSYFQASLNNGGVGILDSDADLFAKPLPSGSFGREPIPGLLGKGVRSAKDFGSKIASSSAYQNFMPSKLGGNAGPLQLFKSLSADSLKDIGGRLGVITSAVGMMVVAKKMSEARSEYFKKLILTGESPDPEYLNLGLKQAWAGITETSANLVMNTMFDVPSVLFEGLGLGRLVGAITNSSSQAVGLAIDMVGMDFKEALGLTEADYAGVVTAQNAWRKAYKTMQEQTRAQAQRTADSVGQRMQDLGASGVSLDELSKAIYKGVAQNMLLKADKNFNEANPFPTSRDVNPYGTDGSSGLATAITRVAIPVSFLFD